MTWLAQSHPWASGPWTVQRRDDELADISYDGAVVLRSIRAVVRDRNWDTAPLIVDRVRETETTLSIHVRSEALGSSFRGIVRVEARPAGLLVLCDLESQAAFATNRTGLVVLHAPGAAGADLTVIHPDGTSKTSAFPEAIAPHQPVVGIAGLAWRQGAHAIGLRFDGDVFEMEDQRNWTDASYKTYSRPLSLPFPYPVAAGERVVQSVLVTVTPDAATPASPAPADRIVLEPAGAVPAIGVGASTAPDPAPAVEPVGAFVLVELDLSSSNWRAALDRAAASRQPLDVRFIVDPDTLGTLEQGVRALVDLPVTRVGVFDAEGDARHVSPAPTVAALRAALADADLDLAVIGGSRSHFTELNRERHRLPADLDGLATTATPLFHSTGTEQLIESVEMQRLVARQTVAYAAGVPVHIGPISLRPRFNDVATAPQPGPSRDDLAEGYGAAFTGTADPRQDAPELAAWTIASAAALAVDGVASLTYFEEWGPRGLRREDGAPRPVHAAIAALGALSGRLLTGGSPDGLLWAIGAADASGTTVLVANLDRVARRLTVDSPAGEASALLDPFAFTTLHLSVPDNEDHE